MNNYIILAGNGFLPINVIKVLKEEKKNFYILIISEKGWDKQIQNYSHKIINLGSIITELLLLKKIGFNNIVFAGSIKRPNISGIKPDIKSLKILPKLIKIFLKGGDNFLLKFVISELEKMKFKVHSIKSIAPNLFLSEGNFTKSKPNKINIYDIDRGKKILNTLSKFDIGQSIIVQQGTVIGIESIEGTDELIKRCNKFFKEEGDKAVLIKLFKKNQEFKADLPTLGMRTFSICKKYKIGGIVFSANKTLFIEHKKIIEKMNINKMFLFGINA